MSEKIMAEMQKEIDELRAQLAGLQQQKDNWVKWAKDCGAEVDKLAAQQAAVPDECPHLILFDDTEVGPILLAGSGARKAALAKWEQISGQWNAHLFVRVAKNRRDDRYPCATLAAPTAPQQGVSKDRSDSARSSAVPMAAHTSSSSIRAAHRWHSVNS